MNFKRRWEMRYCFCCEKYFASRYITCLEDLPTSVTKRIYVCSYCNNTYLGGIRTIHDIDGAITTIEERIE